MRQRVYIETSVPSFYHEVRPEPEMVARRQWTREWWESCAEEYELVTSIPVLEELERGKHPAKKDALALVADLPILPIEDPIEEIVDTYIQRHVMPKDPRGDALHLALASYHRCQFLLTWNCEHLANANKREHIRHVNTLLGLPVPILATPLELLDVVEED
ncbi:type II toxin-antitoxin system VapC family toxin [Planctomycetota bacterium]